MRLKIKFTTFIIILFFITSFSFALTFEESVKATLRADSSNKNMYNIICSNAIANNDLKTLNNIIEKWESEAFHDADLYNMKFQRALSNIIKTKVVSSYEKPNNSTTYIELWDEENQKEIYSYEVKFYDPLKVPEVSKILEHAIIFHPDRLDFYFSLMDIYKNAEFYDKLYSVCLQCFSRLDQNNNKWLYTFNKFLKNNENKNKQDIDFICTITEGYIQPLMKLNTKASRDCADRLSDALENQYPNNVETYNYLAVSNLLYGNQYKGLEYLEKGIEIDPSNIIILENAATFYGINKMEKEFYNIIKRLRTLGEDEKANALMTEYIFDNN